MPTMARGFDHVVHAVRDLDAAAAIYGRLGFTVGARNRHPWGTHNRIVQFPGAFIEPLTLAEPDKLGGDGFSRLFGAYAGEFLAGGQGLSLLILESHDAEADAAHFRAAGIAASEVMRFKREGERPDGSAVKVGFSLAFAAAPQTRDIHFATCQQHHPENFWSPAFQRHANNVTGIVGVGVGAVQPERQRSFFEAFTGGAAAEVDGGFAIATPRGVIDVLTPAAYTARYGVSAPELVRGPRLAALRFAVGDAAMLQSIPEKTAMAGLEAGSPKVIGPRDALGATLVFEAKS